MQSITQVITSGNDFEITPDMGIVQFSAVGLSDSAVWSYLGKASVGDLTPEAIPFTGKAIYNSKPSSNTSQTWTNVVISVDAGSVGLELFTD